MAQMKQEFEAQVALNDAKHQEKAVHAQREISALRAKEVALQDAHQQRLQQQAQLVEERVPKSNSSKTAC